MPSLPLVGPYKQIKQQWRQPHSGIPTTLVFPPPKPAFVLAHGTAPHLYSRSRRQAEGNTLVASC